MSTDYEDEQWEKGRKHGIRQAWRPHDARVRELEAEIESMHTIEEGNQRAWQLKCERVRALEAENARLRTRQEYATADWCIPAGLDEVIDHFVATYNPWPDYPGPRQYIDPIEGETRHAIRRMAPEITRVCLEQADLQMHLDAARDPADAATELTHHDQAHGHYDAGHCTDPDPHTPHEYADDTDPRHCTGTPTTAPTHGDHDE